MAGVGKAARTSGPEGSTWRAEMVHDELMPWRPAVPCASHDGVLVLLSPETKERSPGTLTAATA